MEKMIDSKELESNDEQWEEVIDFTINRNRGVSIEEILHHL